MDNISETTETFIDSESVFFSDTSLNSKNENEKPEETVKETKNNLEIKEEEEEAKWEDILGSQAIMKKTLKKGTENSRPVRTDICIVNYKCTLEDDTEVATVENMKIQVGDLEDVQALDLILTLMNLGEKCLLVVEPRLAYGSLGLENKVPPNCKVKYEIELLQVEPEPDIVQMSLTQRQQIGDEKKKRGNWWYLRGENTFAIQCYRRALEYLDDSDFPIGVDKDNVNVDKFNTALQEIMEDRINVTNNMAAAQMKLGAYDAAMQSLQAVLRCQPNNVKALYRKAKVLRAKNEITDAVKCLQKAKELEPENTIIHKEIQELNAILVQHKNYERELAKRMISTKKESISKDFTAKKKNKSMMWASVAVSVAVGIAGIAAWKFRFS